MKGDLYLGLPKQRIVLLLVHVYDAVRLLYKGFKKTSLRSVVGAREWQKQTLHPVQF